MLDFDAASWPRTLFIADLRSWSSGLKVYEQHMVTSFALESFANAVQTGPGPKTMGTCLGYRRQALVCPNPVPGRLEDGPRLVQRPGQSSGFAFGRGCHEIGFCNAGAQHLVYEAGHLKLNCKQI